MKNIGTNHPVARTVKTLILAGTVFMAVLGSAIAEAPATNLYEELNADKRLSLFANAVSRAGMSDVLQREGEYILLVPANRSMVKEGSAFLLNGLLLTPPNAERLKDLVSHHIIDAGVPDGDADFVTLQNTNLRITVMGDAVVIDGYAVVTERKVLDNGVLYVIDRLLLPKYQQNF